MGFPNYSVCGNIGSVKAGVLCIASLEGVLYQLGSPFDLIKFSHRPIPPLGGSLRPGPPHRAAFLHPYATCLELSIYGKPMNRIGVKIDCVLRLLIT